VVALCRGRARGSLPQGLSRLPGPTLLVVARYVDSPVGPYLELAVGEPARLGLRPGLCITTMVVTSADSRVGGVVNWGFPKELGTLLWSPLDNGVEVAWKEREIDVRSHPYGRWSAPSWMPLRAVQQRGDGPVVVPGRCRGWARPARITVDVPDDDPLAGLAGRHWGVQVGGLRMVMDPARHPSGLTSTLRAPLRSAEPALASSSERPMGNGYSGPPRAYSSVG
jgi:hypothetical protein